MSNIYAGFDVGKDGAMTLIDDNCHILFMQEFPRIGTGSSAPADYMLLCDWIIELLFKYHSLISGRFIIGYEDVKNVRMSGALANFNFGESKGMLKGMFNMLARLSVAQKLDFRISITSIPAKEWQGLMWVHQDKVFESPSKVDTKATSETCARRLYPEADFTKRWNGKGIKPYAAHTGKVDSLLIANAIRHKHNGGI